MHIAHMKYLASMASMIQPPDYMTPKQAAAYLGMSVQWVWKKISAGDGPPIKRRGKKILMLSQDVVKWNENKIIP